jgi:hypothetical protein
MKKRRPRRTDEAKRDLRELQRRYGRRVERDLIYAVQAIQNGERAPGDHALKGQLPGWRAFAVGPQDPPEAPRVVYYLTSHEIVIFAAGEHEQAYTRAVQRRYPD